MWSLHQLGAMAEARVEKADWEKARDWLNDEKITVKSVKVSKLLCVEHCKGTQSFVIPNGFLLST